MIARGNRPLLQLVPVEDLLRPRVPGSAAGEVRIAADFDEIPPGFDE